MPRPEQPRISLVIPVFNESENVDRLYADIMKLMAKQKWDYELIYVNDGSQDDTIANITAISSPNVRLINFSRNFGKEAATTAGIRAAQGDAVIMLDGDGQHPIELITTFMERWQAGAQVVVGVRRANVNEGLIKRYGSRLYYRFLNTLTDGQTVPGSTDFRLIDREVANKFNELTEHNRITRGLIDWLGYNPQYIEFQANAREAGKAGYSYRKLIKLALHGFVSQSTRPLLFTGALGIFVVAVSVVLGLFMVTEQYLLNDPLSLGITGTAILAVFLSFLIGIVLGCQGLLALYIESIHNETQNRPLYIIREDT
jgi:glycosyltransferase involved in cell wall biosynthesis